MTLCFHNKEEKIFAIRLMVSFPFSAILAAGTIQSAAKK
jgi:hypothetical protein